MRQSLYKLRIILGLFDVKAVLGSLIADIHSWWFNLNYKLVESHSDGLNETFKYQHKLFKSSKKEFTRSKPPVYCRCAS